MSFKASGIESIVAVKPDNEKDARIDQNQLEIQFFYFFESVNIENCTIARFSSMGQVLLMVCLWQCLPLSFLISSVHFITTTTTTTSEVTKWLLLLLFTTASISYWSVVSFQMGIYPHQLRGQT